VNLQTDFTLTVSGKWGAHDLISIPPGRYRIFGDSRAREVCSDICSFTFDDTVTVSSATITLTLKARYACALILLDTTNIQYTQFSSTHPNPMVITKGMMKTEDLYHSFMSDDINTAMPYFSFDLLITRRPLPGADFGTGIGISLTSFKWEMGKYYYLENTGNNYTLTPMISN
jgi:hypothetical protein